MSQSDSSRMDVSRHKKKQSASIDNHRRGKICGKENSYGALSHIILSLSHPRAALCDNASPGFPMGRRASTGHFVPPRLLQRPWRAHVLPHSPLRRRPGCCPEGGRKRNRTPISRAHSFCPGDVQLFW